MGAINQREVRTCVRCGRTGSSAFRPIPLDHGQMGWMCSHVDPCVARMRTRHRSGIRRSEGRPPTSPIAPTHLSERAACVIGSDASSVDQLADILAEFAAVDVDRLDLSRRSLDLVSRRDYGLVVIDNQADDSVAFANELTRRLKMTRRRGCAVVIARDDGPMSPAVERLTSGLGAPSVTRPCDATSFMTAVMAALDGQLVGAAS